ncbi:MAG: PAS domain S-box protein [Acidobacteria bacterium]|nr:PAS domain S-box protein [Acidobacteriota bacterium]
MKQQDVEQRIGDLLKAPPELGRALGLLMADFPLAAVALDLEGRVKFWNAAAAHLFGWTAAEVLGGPLPIIPEDKKEEARVLGSLVARGNTFKAMEVSRCRKDGSLVVVSLSALPLQQAVQDGKGGEGKPRGILLLMEDLSDRQRLAGKVEVYREIFLRSEDAVAILDEQGNYLEQNPAHYALLGYADEELRGSTPRVHLGDATYSSVLDGLKRSGIFQGEVTSRTKSGRRVAFHLSTLKVKTPEENEGEGSGRFLSIARNVRGTDGAPPPPPQAVSAEASLVEQSPDAILVHSEGKIILVNSVGLKLFGASESGQLVGRKLADFWHPDVRESLERKIEQSYREGREISLQESRLIRPDGQMRDVELTGSTFDYQGKKAGEMILRDVTERKRRQAALHEQEAQHHEAEKLEAVGRLAGGMAHDFNNLLMVICGYCELLAARVGSESPRLREVEEIHKAAKRAAALTDQLLAFDAKQMVVASAFDLNVLVRRMDRPLRKMLGDEIELELVLDPDLGLVKADSEQIERVVHNLAQNGKDAMPDGGRLVIETANVNVTEEGPEFAGATPGPSVLLAVSDTGQGVDTETRAHFFEPFFTTKKKGEGAGLGLAAVYGIVKQSGGHIWVYSEPGQGTTMKVYLPRIEQPEGAGAAEIPLSASSPGTETVLLVEDEMAVRRVAKDYLERNGYTVLEAGDGNEALTLCEVYDGPIHIMLADVELPEMDGPDLARRVAPLRPELKILYVSGYTAGAIRQHGINAPDSQFLQKPFSLANLGRKIREVLETHPPIGATENPTS